MRCSAASLSYIFFYLWLHVGRGGGGVSMARKLDYSCGAKGGWGKKKGGGRTMNRGVLRDTWDAVISSVVGDCMNEWILACFPIEEVVRLIRGSIYTLRIT